MTAGSESLASVLEQARTAGFLGPGPVEPHILHSAGFGEVVEITLGRVPDRLVDLGTGGGVPGLGLVLRWPDVRAVFVDSAQRRCAFLREALSELGLDDRVEVVEERAEVVAGPGPYREQFELVTARSFAEPAVTAEIASGLVGLGGVLAVSEPPDSDGTRWNPEALAKLGFAPAEPVERAGAHFAVMRKTASAPDRYPRGVGRPSKRPLW